MTIKTIFKINGESYSIEATGQRAAKAIRQQFRGSSISIVGFHVNDKFIPVKIY